MESMGKYLGAAVALILICLHYMLCEGQSHPLGG